MLEYTERNIEGKLLFSLTHKFILQLLTHTTEIDGRAHARGARSCLARTLLLKAAIF